MIGNKEQNVFEAIISPILPLVKEAANSIKGDSETYKLSFYPFTLNLLFALINNIKTIGQLITEIKTSTTAMALDLVLASKSMYSESFYRYNPENYRKILIQLLDKLKFIEIADIKSLGRILLIDGSLFPAIKSMVWASYKRTANAIKLHLAFELNRMIPVQFISTEGNYSEKKFIMKILEKGITYICDRGYISFNLFKNICNKGAFFIIRGKSNMDYKIMEHITVNIPNKFLHFLEEVKELKIVFNNDGNKILYRIVTFTAVGESYILITNRFDLTTYEIIMLYAYRWQVELIFRFFKRTLNGIHLMSHDSGGIEIQFYLYMITYLLLLSFKQKCVEIDNANQLEEDVSETMNENSGIINESHCTINSKVGRQYVCGLVSLLGEGLQKYWKIGIHWLITVKNLLLTPFTVNIAKIIALKQ